jgi:hypothetical protein
LLELPGVERVCVERACPALPVVAVWSVATGAEVDAVPVVDGVPTADSDSDETPPFSARFCTRNGLPRGNVRGPAYGS